MIQSGAEEEEPVYWGWDLETVNWGDPLAACAMSSRGDEIRLYGPDCVQKLCKTMREIKGTWLAHGSGIFDTLIALRYLRASTIIQTGSSILCANVGHLKLRDSFPWWLASLAKVGDAVELPKLDVDRGRIEELTRAECLTYCMRDCEILMRGARACLDFLKARGAGRRWTAGGSAMALLAALEPSSAALMRRFRPEAEDCQSALRSIRGGRVECWARGHVPRVFSYDFRSSYPARYASSSVGLGLRRARGREPYGVFRCRWNWPYRTRIPPALDHMTAGGFGWCEGELADCEIAAFEEAGAEVRVGEGWAPLAMVPVGHELVRELFAAKEGGGTDAFFSKVFLNSASGKLSENPYKVQWSSRRPRKWVGPEPERLGDYWRSYSLQIDRQGRAPWNCHPIASAQILARARVALWRVFRHIEAVGGEVYYCDTDSIHTDLPPERMIGIGDGLGELALEAGPCEGVYLGPKSYLLHNNGEPVKAALKGFPFKALSSAIYENGGYSTDKGADGFDLRYEVFETALKRPVTVRRESLATFIEGIGTDWPKIATERTLRPTGRGKRLGAHGWAYQSPGELGFDRTP